MALKDNLIAYFACEEDSGVLQDSHGANTLTNSGADYSATGKDGECLDYNGSTDYAYTDFAPNYESRSISCWIYSDGTPSGDVERAWEYDSNSATYGLAFIGRDTSGKIKFQQSLSSFTTAAAISDTTWYHVVMTQDGTTVRCYLNGSEVDDFAQGSTHSGDGDNALIIASNRSQSVPNRMWDGRVDEIAIWNRKITADEVSEIYNGGTGLFYDDWDAEADTNCQINIGDNWKVIDAMQINIGDVWKAVEGAQINIGDTWKTIF